MKNKSGLRTFENATAIVTGAASGIGAALSRELALRGCDVVLADLQIELAREVARGIRESDGRATAAMLDVTDYTSFEQLVKDTVKRTGRLDYLFNNAGIGIIGPISEYKIEDWDYIIKVNLYGEVNGIQAAYRTMVNQGFGHIVNTSSMAGLTTIPLISYSMTKYAIVGLSKGLRAEAALNNVRVSVICPGTIRTPLFEGGKYGRSVITADEDNKKISEMVVRMLEKSRPMDPAVFAKKVLEKVAKNRAIIIVPAYWRIFWWLERLFPVAMINMTQLQIKAISSLQKKRIAASGGVPVESISS